MSLRILLPPNLPDAAGRDAIPVKLEVLPEPDFSNPQTLAAFALVQSWCPDAAKPPPFLQLSRAQLRELISVLEGQMAFAFANNPRKTIFWQNSRLIGVSQYLDETKTEPVERKVLSSPKTSRTATPAKDNTPPTVDGSEHYLAITLPSRESYSYRPMLELLRDKGFVLDPSSRKWWLRDRHKTLNFLARHGRALREEYFAEFSPNFEKNLAKLSEAEIAIQIEDSGRDFAVTAGFETNGASDEQLRTALVTGRNYVEGAGGRILLLSPGKTEQLAKAQQILSGGMGTPASGRRTYRVNAARAAEIQELIEEIVPGYQAPAAWTRRAEALRNLSSLSPAPIPPGFTAELRPYQQLGAAWLWHLHKHKLGGILADEMGLGKTIQALALVSAVLAENDGPALVVCPASLMENWRRECVRFAPQLKVFVHHGAKRLGRKNKDGITQHDLIITSYGTLARDSELFSDISLKLLIADEAQHVKNRRTQNARALRSLEAESRFLLTGTPIENALDDLRSLFEILLPGFLDKKPTAAQGFRPEERAWFDERLRKQTAPYILRRTKAAVAPELPPKIEQILYCDPSPAQNKLYQEWQRRSERELFDMGAGGASESAIRMATLTQLLRLRQICCDPRLVSPDQKSSDSAKFEVFRELFEEAVDDGHRLLVFSQFTSLLGLLRAEFDEQKIEYCYLDGSLNSRQRQSEVDRFNNSEVPVFFISLKAGGTGLNLTGADTVVHFDPWWNPAAEAQATDRAHRIGQTRTVTSYKLICSGTVEEKVLHLQESKRALLSDVFEASDTLSAKLTLDDLNELLR